MKAVVDTNVVVSASISPKGPPAEIIRAWRAQLFTWVTSPELLAEIEKVLLSSRLQRYQAWSEDEIQQFMRSLRAATILVEPSERLEVVHDPADNRLLEAAVEAQADVIVTGDSDLLDIGSYKGIDMVPPSRFVWLLTHQ